MRVELEEDPMRLNTDMGTCGELRMVPAVTLLVHFEDGEVFDASKGQQLSVLKFSAREAWARVHDAMWQGPTQ